MLRNSLMNYSTIMTAGKTMKCDPSRSVLRHNIGDRIKLNETDFERISSAIFAEIESKSV
jgi:hypothetical protein